MRGLAGRVWPFSSSQANQQPLIEIILLRLSQSSIILTTAAWAIRCDDSRPGGCGMMVCSLGAKCPVQCNSYGGMTCSHPMLTAQRLACSHASKRVNSPKAKSTKFPDPVHGMGLQPLVPRRPSAGPNCPIAILQVSTSIFRPLMPSTHWYSVVAQGVVQLCGPLATAANSEIKIASIDRAPD